MEAGKETMESRSCDPPQQGLLGAGDGATPRCHKSLFVFALLALYASTLTHGLTRPWIGMHDWNGAFYSQLARNLLRYPASVHHGMSVVAVGEAVPPPQERSFYAAHPQGLVWLIALSFSLFGEAEWVARLVPILASFGSLALLVWLVRRSYGFEMAALTGLLFGVTPMTAYFGRMVDQEPVCLLFMLAALACWQFAAGRGRCTASQTFLARIGWIAAIAGVIAVDWSGVLFAGLFCVHALLRFRRGRISVGLTAMVLGASCLLTAAMLIHLVYAGFGGRFEDLPALFMSRFANPKIEDVHDGFLAPAGPAKHIIGNLTWPLMVLACAGFAFVLLRTRQGGDVPPQTDEGRAAHKIDAAWVLSVTGILWVAVFWGQFERHNYWMYYVGPAVLFLGARAIVAVRDAVLPVGGRLATVALYGLAAVVVAVGLRGTDEYFRMETYPREAVTAWKRINAATRPGDRVLLYADPVVPEMRGGYVLRNLVPTQQIYYLDRAFDVEKNFSAVVEKSAGYAAYIVPVSVALAQSEQLSVLETRFPRRVLGLGESEGAYAVAVFDLRPGGLPWR